MGRVYGMCWFGVVMVMESWVSKEIRALQAPWVGEGAVGAHHELLAHVGMVGMGWEAAHPDPSFLRSCGALGEPHQMFLVVGSPCGVLLGWLSEGDVGCFVAVLVAAANTPGAGGARPRSEVAHVVWGPQGQGVCFQGK